MTKEGGARFAGRPHAYVWVASWADVLPIEVTPCLEDADAGAVLPEVRQ